MVSSGCIVPPPGLEAAAKGDGPQASCGNSSSIPAPPGLDDLCPAKVAVHKTVDGLWMNAVLAASPHLSPEGLYHALAIVDRAIRNAQHAKALDELLGSADQSNCPSMSYIQSAACLRAQISCEQLQPAAPPSTQPLVVPTAVAATAQEPAKGPSARAPKACPKAGKTSERAGEKPSNRPPQTLSSSLQLLSHENPDCLFIVRHINKLGFKASRTLKRHYSAYGAVVRVLVAHSTVRQHGSPDCHARRRPSSLGFLQMATPEAVKAILAAGPEQEVDGAMIRIQKFERQQTQTINEEEQVEDHASWAFERHTSSGSDNSLATISTGISEDSCISKGYFRDNLMAEAELDFEEAAGGAGGAGRIGTAVLSWGGAGRLQPWAKQR
eukprot:CAMPEP_0175561990 /NCGR_PEP_ID=MMETSP0096-20121207/37692_1 /TAXON_ID=311494 /ORGANISM="Alexandrium monilatum, Strain CCMP3105" /LENGTH=382 /DNA_ID=CAMNT_0016865221 /DNA_START=26 /DNA_END=1172 /DNA_ORIENTATION=-